MHEEGITILRILDQICINFRIDAQGTNKITEGFTEYLPEQDKQVLRECLLKIHNDLKTWDGMGDGVEVIHGLYTDIGKSLKGLPTAVGALRGFFWTFSFKPQLMQPEHQPMINVTIGQIGRILDGYAKS